MQNKYTYHDLYANMTFQLYLHFEKGRPEKTVSKAFKGKRDEFGAAAALKAVSTSHKLKPSEVNHDESIC